MASPQTDTKCLQEQLFLLTISDATMGQQLVKACGFIEALGILRNTKPNSLSCPHGLQPTHRLRTEFCSRPLNKKIFTSTGNLHSGVHRQK